MRDCYVVRVFTRGDAGGNHLGVVPDMTGLDTEAMQRIASDLGFSETIFFDRTETVPTARIFTPAVELPFAGHPLVGAAWVLDRLAPGSADLLSCPAFLVRLRVDGGLTWVDVPLGQPVDEIEPPEGFSAVSAAVVRMPLPYLVLQLPDSTAVARATASVPDGYGEVYIWAWETEPTSVRARFFAPEAGVMEDPATGSAAVALAALLRHRGADRGALRVQQGDEIGHPSTIELSWAGDEASIGGTVRQDEIRVLDS
jgi:trans-2,3-dihydro-3-hydroxyanthranilate isomerase